MSYGSASYGSTTYGGIPNSADEQMIYPLQVYQPGEYERIVNFSGTEELYTIFTEPTELEEPATTFRIYGSHGGGETPQLLSTTAGFGSVTIGARPIIIVTASVDEAVRINDIFRVYGRPGA